MKVPEAAILKALDRYSRFVVTMHVNPDPDAVASALVMTLFLRSRGKKVRLVNRDACPSWLEFVPRISLYEKFDARVHSAFAPEALVILDSGDLDRAGEVARLAVKGVKVINIDHHVTNTRFGHHNYVRDGYSSTSEILYGLVKAGGVKVTRDIAVLLYLGILTDTGSFGFDCTSSHTHEVIADLLKFNFSVSDIYRRVYETLPRHDLKPFLAIMGRLELHHGEKVACLVLTAADVAVFSGDFDLKDKIFTFLRSVRGLEVIIILTETDPQENGRPGGQARTRLNFRSRGDVDVAVLAGKFNGGGHRKASGGYCDGDTAWARKKVLSLVGKVL